jgi:hypothetical protein
MSNAKNPNAPQFPPEPPELAAERERLIPEVEKQAKAATGTAQPLLRKFYELMLHTRPGAPFDMQIYQDTKDAFMRFMKDPVLPPPAIIMQCVEYMQKRLVAFGFTGQMQLPEGVKIPEKVMGPSLLQGVQIPNAAGGSVPAAPAAPMAQPAGKKAQDGFEGGGAKPSKMTLNPETAPVPNAPASPDAKSEQQQLESFKTWMKNPSIGKVKG